jgi:Lrp/AsnC family leucine-responsive transcriptional regulator
MILGRPARMKGKSSEVGACGLQSIGFSQIQLFDMPHPSSSTPPGSPRLDKKDRQILKALQADARQSLSALGKEIGLSQPAISERVRKLEEAGVITGYAARLDLKELGLHLEAIVRIRTSHEHIQAYLALFQAMPEVLQVFRVTGEDCFVLHCAFGDPQQLERIVDRLAAHGSVTTSVVLSRPVDRAPPVASA